MKQLFLNLTHGAVVNGGKAIVSTIRAINSRPAQLFWAPLFAINTVSFFQHGGFWHYAAALAAAYLAGRSTYKFFARQSSAPTEAAPTFEEVVDEASRIRDEAASALQAEAQAVVDRIRERTQDEADKAKIEALVGECLTIERKMKARKATLSDTAGNTAAVKPVKPKRPRK